MFEVIAQGSSSVDDIGLLQILVPIVLGLLAGIGGAWATLARYREKVDQLEKVDAQKRLSTIEGQLASISSQITTLQQNSPTNYVQSNSPMKLTDNGRDLLANSGMSKFIDDNFSTLFAKLQEKLNAKTDDYSAYDVQEIALEVIKQSADDKNYIPIKDYAFAEGLTLSNIELVGGIHLRNKSLEALGFDMEAYFSSDDDGQSHKRKKK